MASRLALALPAFAVAVIGLALALALRQTTWPVVLGLVTGFCAFGWIVGEVADRLLLPRHPRCAVAGYAIWALCPGIAAAAAVALLIHLNGRLDPDELGIAGVDKEMMKTTLAAMTALLTGLFINTISDADEALIGERAKAGFFGRFVDAGKNPSPTDYPVITGESAVQGPIFSRVYEGLEGWGARARWRRATAVSRLMRDPAEVARVKAYWAARDATDAAARREGTN